jgi:hypothetical protein
VRQVALEDRELGGLLRDQRDRLHGRRVDADHADALPGDVRTLGGPVPDPGTAACMGV